MLQIVYIFIVFVVVILDTKVVQSVAKQKKSELRIYCDLLMQQVHAIKEANSAEPVDVSVSDMIL